MSTSPVLVIGAGPAGLAVAASLKKRGVPVVVLERADDVGASWRRHYERLHLHTTRRWSGLPGFPIPQRFGRWVARADVVNYLEMYAVHHRLDVRTGVQVKRVARAGYGRWVVETEAGESFTGSTVVVATGYNHTPVPPQWPGVETFPGELVHASAYRNAEPYRGKDVLVVGPGNTGSEIAVDLTEGGASRVRLAIRTAPHIVRRSNLGWPAQGTGILRASPARAGGGPHRGPRGPRRGARPVVVRAAATDHRPLLAREAGLGPAAGRRPDRGGAGGTGRAGRGGGVVRRRCGACWPTARGSRRT